MEPEFGCGMHDYVFAPNNADTRAAIMARGAGGADPLGAAHRRAGASRPTRSSTRRTRCCIEVDYRIRANNALRNIVYPFFLNEGPA